MMDTEVDRELLEKIADLIGKPVGAFNIRKDTGCDGRQSTEHIEITSKTDKPGIDIRVKPGTMGETCHIPVIITKPGIEEIVYNDFYIGENSNVDIVAGCGIHNCGNQASQHDGVHTFYVGKNSHVHYTEKHYGDGDGKGGRIMNPSTIVYLEEGASFRWTTPQIRGLIPPSATQDRLRKDAEAVITERLLTHGEQLAEATWNRFDGENSRPVILPPVAQTSPAAFKPLVTGTPSAVGHVHATLSLWDGRPSLRAGDRRQLHGGPAHPRGAIGKIAGDQLLKLQTLVDGEEAGTSSEGFLA